ncbi:SPFH domain-containing protein [Halodesulfovibrio marinisediminis]|uniref:SPFH domain, Band 7 family protein n=1 Tax=Halodesulfovibrio marinisediminis DSM 17456 TaxID=1121457 RepID=A0A1N6FWE3_9BACT|nr:stomatin-like protein [Halodesulfovibrio marinisediminis]SIN99531.1 SPFH domain, Band 7 family protein [Halodesulfovibrio marinisediminis DSM 17456]
MTSLITSIVIAVLVLITLIKTAVVVPQRSSYVIERLGKYSKTLEAGLHILIPFVDKVAYRRSTKEEILNIPSQSCITSDNVVVEIDGVLYIQVQDVMKSCYGVNDYYLAAGQLAQTSLRSAIGKISLDKTFEERDSINAAVVSAIDEAAREWGIKVMRYEIQDITPPETVMHAMEQQMKAEREKRAEIASSEGDRQSRINRAEGLKQEAIELSEGEKQKKINEAAGQAEEIMLIAEATAKGITMIADAMAAPGGAEAAKLKIAEQFINEFGKMAEKSNTMIVPADMANVGGMVASATEILNNVKLQK